MSSVWNTRSIGNGLHGRISKAMQGVLIKMNMFAIPCGADVKLTLQPVGLILNTCYKLYTHFFFFTLIMFFVKRRSFYTVCYFFLSVMFTMHLHSHYRISDPQFILSNSYFSWPDRSISVAWTCPFKPRCKYFSLYSHTKSANCRLIN